MGTEYSVDELIEQLDVNDAWKVTRWLDPKNVIRVTRKLYNGRISKRNLEYVVTFCKPNYAEREYAKPRSDIQMWFRYPPKKAKVAR